MQIMAAALTLLPWLSALIRKDVDVRPLNSVAALMGYPQPKDQTWKDVQIVTVITGTTHCNSRNRTFIQKRRTFIQKRRSTVVFGPLKPTNRFEFRNTRTERRPSPGRGRRRLRCDKVCSSVTIRSWSRRVVLVADLIRSNPLRSARCELTGSDSIGSDASPDGNPACVCADLSHHAFKSFDLGHKPFRPLFYAISVPPPPTTTTTSCPLPS